MSGGIPAIRGFDYQATVTLDLIFEHFDSQGEGATIRPEGTDDIDLHLHAAATHGASFSCVQVKKPTEFADTTPNPKPWTVIRAADELLPNAIANLDAGATSQRWILGDGPDADLQSLVDAGSNASTAAKTAYWKALQYIAMRKALVVVQTKDAIRQSLLRHRPPEDLSDDPAQALLQTIDAFETRAKDLGAKAELAAAFSAEARALHPRLPLVLECISIRTSGTEQEIVERVYQRLKDRYSFSRELIERTVFRNLRGFVYDIQKQPGRTFDKEEFETELRCVWPEMVSVKTPPKLQFDHVARRDLSSRMVLDWEGRALEMIGVSGSGKSSLATEVITRAELEDPGRTSLYVEIRPDLKLRDVLAGIAFSLRRIGVDEPFRIAIDGRSANEEAIAALSKSLSRCGKSVLIIMDLVEGTCSDALMREFATFARALAPSDMRVAVLGQRSAFGALSDAERDALGIARIEMRGFRLEEFCEIAGHHHPDVVPGDLSKIYDRVTVGRPSGLSALLAQLLARAASLEEMTSIVSRPPDAILPRAEADRFAKLSDGARDAAGALVCFALPFSRKDAEEIFPELQIGLAIREMVDLGLLSTYDTGLFEMHEAVRAGLEETLAVGARQRTHGVLAGWYGGHNMASARIYHLEKAGRESDALNFAKQTFLRGESWSALAPFVISRGLVTSDEVIRTFLGERRISDGYLLPQILKETGGETGVDDFLDAIRNDPRRLNSDHHWMSAIFTVVIELAPERVHDLVELLIGLVPQLGDKRSVFAWLGIAASRSHLLLSERTIALFVRQSSDIKRVMLRLLLSDWRRNTLRHAFGFMIEDWNDLDWDREPVSYGLRLRTRADVAEFLASIPTPATAAMLHAKSALLGPFANPVWQHREELRGHSIDLISSNEEDAVLINAMRILIDVADPSACQVAAPLLDRSDTVGTVAKFLPAIAPALCDRGFYERMFLNESASRQQRTTALLILAKVGSDLGTIRSRLRQAGGSDADAWDAIFLIAAAEAPFRDAIPLLESALLAESAPPIPSQTLAAIGGQQFPEATDLLIKALDHRERVVRQTALVQVRERRARAALEPLKRYFLTHRQDLSAAVALSGILASGVGGVAEVEPRNDDSDSVKAWQCILAGRTRDETFADRLVAFATDTKAHWQLRRAAIASGGRLPHDTVLAIVAPFIMKEHSPLAAMDDPQDLRWHSLIISLASFDAPHMGGYFARGRETFVGYIEKVFGLMLDGDTNVKADPKRAAVAVWLYDRLYDAGWASDPSALDRLIDRLHVPLIQSALLRALVQQGEPEKIAEFLPAISDPWLGARCAIALAHTDQGSDDVRLRVRSLIERGPLKDDAYLHRVVDDLRRIARSAESETTGIGHAEAARLASVLTEAEAFAVLSGKSNLNEKKPPFAIEDLDPHRLQALVRAADPANAVQDGVVERYIPGFSFKREGHVVSQRQVTYSGSGKSDGDAIRAAIAAAHDDPSKIRWHVDGLHKRHAKEYVTSFLESVQARGDAEKLFGALTEDPDLTMHALCSAAERDWGRRQCIDVRIVPFIIRYARTGTDAFFGGLWSLALNIPGVEIDDALSALFDRWTNSFDSPISTRKNDQNVALWRAFDRLSEHPRFDCISSWPSRIATVLATSPSFHFAEKLMEILARDPRSYAVLEAQLLKAVDWQHYLRDGIDHLDEQVDRLFKQLIEE